MDDQSEITIRIFDQVGIRTTKNVKYMSAPNGVVPSPHGEWSVSCAVGQDLLITQNSVVVRIPVGDVLLVRRHNIQNITDHLGKLRNVETKEGSPGHDEA